MKKIIWTITELITSPFMVLGYIYESIDTSFKQGRSINQNQWGKYGK